MGVMQLADNSAVKTMDQTFQGLFLPDTLGRLVRRSKGRGRGSLTVYRRDADDAENYELSVRYELTTLGQSKTFNSRSWSRSQRYNVVYIPVKDMLANSPGFKSLYDKRAVSIQPLFRRSQIDSVPFFKCEATRVERLKYQAT